MFKSTRFAEMSRWWRTIRGYELYPHELQAIAVLLSGTDQRLERFRLQWECAIAFKRGVLKDGSITTRWTMSNAPLVPMMINSDLQSRPVTLIDAVFGCTLTYTITIGTTGCCAPLSLKAPALTRIDWRTRASSQSIREALAQTPYVHLPEVADQSATRMRLTANNIQLQMNPASWDYLELREPATNVDLEELTQSIEGSAPADYLQFMTCSNGMLIGEVLLLPIKDAIRFAKSYVRSIGQSVILAQDVINGLADGFWFMPVSGAKSGLVMHVDNYGKVDGNGITLAAFLQELVDRNHEYTDRMRVVPRKRLRELHPDRMHRNAVNEFYPSA